MKRNLNVLLAVMTVGSLLTGCSTKEELYVKDVTVELGDEVVLKVDNYLDEEKSVLKEETEVTLDTTNFEDKEKFNLDTDTYVVTTVDKDYLEVGEYDIVLKANELESTGKLIVEDTTAPEFVDFKDTIKVEENAENVDLTKYFKTKDLSEVEISVDQGSFDISNPGIYDIKVTAKDEYDNKTEKDCKVIVVETEKEDDNNTSTQSSESASSSNVSSGNSGGQTSSQAPVAPQLQPQPQKPAPAPAPTPVPVTTTVLFDNGMYAFNNMVDGDFVYIATGVSFTDMNEATAWGWANKNNYLGFYVDSYKQELTSTGVRTTYYTVYFKS